MTAASPATVLFLVDSLGLSGKTKGLVDVALHLDPARYRPVVYSFAQGESGILATRLRDNGIPVETAPCRDGLNFRMVGKLAGIMRRVKPSVVHCYNPRPIVYGGLAAVLSGIPGRVGSLSAFACQVPDRTYGYLPQPLATVSRKNVYRNRLAARLMRHIITVSATAGKRFFQYNKLPFSKLQVIPYGVDLEHSTDFSAGEVSRLRSEMGFDPRHVVVGSVGRLVEEKDYPTQLRAFAEAARKEDALRMVLAGSGPLETPLRALAKDLGIEDRVRFLGLCNHVPLLMRALDIFVLASKFETFGVVLLEAKAAGLPIIASGINEIPDIVREGKDGLLFPAGDVHKLAALFVNLAQNPESRSALGREALADANDRFSMNAVVGRLQELYDSIRNNS